MLGAVFGIQIGAALRIVIELRAIVLEGQVYQCAIRSVKLYRFTLGSKLEMCFFGSIFIIATVDTGVIFEVR